MTVFALLSVCVCVCPLREVLGQEDREVNVKRESVSIKEGGSPFEHLCGFIHRVVTSYNSTKTSKHFFKNIL